MAKAPSLLVKNPRLFARILYAYVMAGVRAVPSTSAEKQIDGLRFEFDFTCGPQIKRMYFGYYEPLVIEAMKKCLREGDTFIDVGASIGYISAMAATMVGRSGQVHSFEPAPRDFERLKRLFEMNPEFNLICNPCALGEKQGTADLDISKLFWVGWNTLVPGFMRENARQGAVGVPVMRLDRYIRERRHKMGKIAMIKTDTEGFDFHVLKGLQNFFEETDDRPPIICEVTPRALGLLGVSLGEFSDYMGRYGYRAYSLMDLKTEVDISTFREQGDVLFRAGR